jgi:hypothetical protein
VVKLSEVLPMGRKGELCRKSGRSERRRWRAMVEEEVSEITRQCHVIPIIP